MSVVRAENVVGDNAAGSRQLLGDLAAALSEALFEVARGLLEGFAHIGALLGKGVDDATAGFGERAGDLARAVLKMRVRSRPCARRLP